MPSITSRFDVTRWDDTPDGDEGEGPRHGEARVSKRYHGDLEAEGRARVLMCSEGGEGPVRNAGYIASERVEGRLAGREGTFVLQHWGIIGADSPPRTGGHVVPGSGTGELAGLSGTMEIRVDSDGTHTLAMDYRFG